MKITIKWKDGNSQKIHFCAPLPPTLMLVKNHQTEHRFYLEKKSNYKKTWYVYREA